MKKLKLNMYETAIQDETEFLIQLIQYFDDIDIHKTKDRYNFVDFELKKHNIHFLNMELKSRDNISSYRSLRIGYVKLNALVNLKHDTILVWLCKKTKSFYYCIFQPFMLDLDLQYDGRSTYVEIPKSFMVHSSSLKSLSDVISEYSML